MPKAWDILAPVPKRREKKSIHPRRPHNNSLWYILIMVILALAFVFGGAKMNLFSSSLSGQTSPIPSPTVTSSPNVLSIKILNSSGRFEEATKIRDLLVQNGYKIKTIETSVNSYDQTLIYYNGGFEDDAAKIANILKDYGAKTQKFSQKSTYDIAIIIGGK